MNLKSYSFPVLMVKGGSVEAMEFPQASTDPKQKVKTLNI